MSRAFITGPEGNPVTFLPAAPFTPLAPGGLPRHVLPRVTALRGDAGMSTVEYAIGSIAAAAFAAVLYTIVTGDSILSALTGLLERALSVSF